jgi:8-oxo-dGTP pyrophosphatase MutT (NUDIX family)
MTGTGAGGPDRMTGTGAGGPDRMTGTRQPPVAAPSAGRATGARPAPAEADRPAGEQEKFPVVESTEVYRGRVIGLRVDKVQMPDGRVAAREVVEHLGAVAVVALDEAGRVVLIRQYRHPTGEYLLELPAGLLDVSGEKAVDTARRELFEEAALRAGTWHTLVDLRTSPGMSDEAVRVFLARDLTEVPERERYAGREEEIDLGPHRVALDEAVRAALDGRVENSIAVAGLLAAAYVRDAGWVPLRPPDSPWPARPGR